jgi:two-component system response regulator
MNDRVILLVEDNAKDEELTLRALRKSSVLNPVVIARDGVQALDYVFARAGHANRSAAAMPQVILLDLKLPKLDGLEVLRTLRADWRTRLIPVVVLTTSNEDQDLIDSYSLGANSYVRKPVDFVQFLEAVRQLALFWLTLNQTAPVTSRS